MKIGIASDHLGYLKKKILIRFLRKNGFIAVDYGPSNDNSVDYPDYAIRVCEAINKDEVKEGILLCGTGIGMSIAANKVKGILCAKVDNEQDAQLSKTHNNANILAVSATKDILELENIILTFLKTTFSNEERHVRRINKIKELEN